MSQQFKYFHPSRDGEKYLSMANIIWAERDKGDAYYRTSAYAMKGGKFPSTHPCFPFDAEEQKNSSQIGWSKKLNAFRARGYWASCFSRGRRHNAEVVAGCSGRIGKECGTGHA